MIVKKVVKSGNLNSTLRHIRKNDYKFIFYKNDCKIVLLL